MAKTAYCPYCDQEQDLISTVPWQPNTCAVCGNPLDDGSDTIEKVR